LDAIVIQLFLLPALYWGHKSMKLCSLLHALFLGNSREEILAGYEERKIIGKICCLFSIFDNINILICKIWESQ